MACRYLDAADVRQAIGVPELIESLAAILNAAATGDATAPGRIVRSVALPERADSTFLVMPGVWGARQSFGAKLVSYVPDNREWGRPTVQGLAVLLDAATGEPRLIADAAAMTTLRTGAMVGLATRFLARDDAATIGIIGTGALAFDLVAGVAAVRDIDKVVAHSRSEDRRDKFVSCLPWRAEAASSPREAAEQADILITCTTAATPVVSRSWIRPGTHINAVGNFSPEGREIDGPTVAAARRWVDDLDNALREAGELILAAGEGLIPEGRDAVEGTLGGLVAGTAEGRRDDDEITLFKSVGMALADLAALVYAAEWAHRLERGLVVDAD